MEEERRKRVRSDTGDQNKHAKRQESEHGHGCEEVCDDGGVFDFPWLKDGVGISRSEEWRLEDDSFLTQLGDRIVGDYEYSTITTATGIEFSFPKQLSLPARDFLDEISDDVDELSTSSSLIEDYFGFDWIAFA